MRRREEAASLGCSAITLIGATTRRSGEPTQWRVPGDLHSNTLTPIASWPLAAQGVWSVTKAPLSEFTLPDRTAPSARVPVCLLCVARGGVCPT